MEDPMNPNLFSPPLTAKLSGSEAPKSPAPTFRVLADLSRSAWISAQARQIYGSYRKDDFSDPDSFLAQLGMVLERYSDPVIKECCSPVSGIQRKSKFPPSIAEVAEFCDAEVARTERLRRFSALRFEQREPRPVDPSARANLLVLFDAPDYVQMVEWAKKNPNSSRDDPRGIWVPMYVYTERNEVVKAAGPRRYTATELKELYTKPLEGGPA